MIDQGAVVVRSGFRAEAGKVGAFLRRDLLVAWSYKVSFFSDIVNLAFQVFIFYFIGQLIDPAKLPQFGGSQTTYLEYVALGIALGAFVRVALRQIAGTFRDEQYQGTLECLMLTPTRAVTIQLGSLVYELIYVPIRTVIFLAVIAVAFGLSFDVGGILPAMVVLLALTPFVWGLGVAAAAGVIAFRRGEGGVGFIATLLTISSGAYFPLTVFPSWLQTLAEANPFAIALDAMRHAVLGGTGWSEVVPTLAELVPLAAVSVVAGHLLYSRALRREFRRGSLGEY